MIEALERRGHNMSKLGRESAAVVQVVMQDPETGVLTAVSDRRKGGRPAGYNASGVVGVPGAEETEEEVNQRRRRR